MCPVSTVPCDWTAACACMTCSCDIHSPRHLACYLHLLPSPHLLFQPLCQRQYSTCTFLTRFATCAAPKDPAPLRAGYLGHLTLVANRMAGAAGRRRAVCAYLDDSEAWHAFAEGTLQVCSWTGPQRSTVARFCKCGHACWCNLLTHQGNAHCHCGPFWQCRPAGTQPQSVQLRLSVPCADADMRLLVLHVQERNARENTDAWECGRPDPRTIQPLATLDADAESGGAFPDDMVSLCGKELSSVRNSPRATLLALLLTSKAKRS